VTSSSNGQYIAAAVYGGGVYTNDNYGFGTWTAQSGVPSGVNWKGIASDSSGKYLVVVGFSQCAYTSQSYGNGTWTEQTGSPCSVAWTSVASDSTGQYLAATVSYSSSGSGSPGCVYTNSVRTACMRSDTLSINKPRAYGRAPFKFVVSLSNRTMVPDLGPNRLQTSQILFYSS
jgi:hypothetical protein